MGNALSLSDTGSGVFVLRLAMMGSEKSQVCELAMNAVMTRSLSSIVLSKCKVLCCLMVTMSSSMMSPS